MSKQDSLSIDNTASLSSVNVQLVQQIRCSVVSGGNVDLNYE